ncbi:MAG TPA: chemotaxis response regulator protein-glutamate methylesterase [Oscillospiraceae bacterium]|nr:chemotaxis response regulator protein-glutamate methylesterase [Oscillospiraceae bacterium]
MPKIRVLVVDDSILFRETLSRAISEDPSIEVIATAGDAFQAEDKIHQLKPDVVTLDVEMPKLNGIDFLKKLIPQTPIPVVVVSAMPVSAFQALDAGAVDFVKKPVVKTSDDMRIFAKELCGKIKIAKNAKVTPGGRIRPDTLTGTQFFAAPNMLKHRDTVIALGASTGGTDALQVVIQNLPETTPPILIVQHMPAGFTNMYATRLNRICKMEVQEAKNGDRLKPGRVLIAAGEYHMRLARDTQGYYVKCAQGDRVSGHCPSVDVLFDSVADIAGKKAIGAILTGMGADGAKGLLKMRKAGAYTIGQDKESCIVYGMPMVAFNIGGVEKQAPLTRISSIIMEKLK